MPCFCLCAGARYADIHNKPLFLDFTGNKKGSELFSVYRFDTSGILVYKNLNIFSYGPNNITIVLIERLNSTEVIFSPSFATINR